MTEETLGGPAIWVDADACPAVLREVLFRAAERTRTRLTLVANSTLRTPPSAWIRSLQVPRGFDVADERIVAELAAGDLVITNDIPLAAQAIARGARVLDMRGAWLDDNTIGDRLAMRNLLSDLRDLGQVGGGPAPLSSADRQAFASRLDQFLHAAMRGRRASGG